MLAENTACSKNQATYVLATAFHETAHKVKPIRELGANLRAKRYYPYVGMGYVQLTWLENYQKASKKLGVDFVVNSKLLLGPKHAAPSSSLACLRAGSPARSSAIKSRSTFRIFAPPGGSSTARIDWT
jgi:hypothetical protein